MTSSNVLLIIYLTKHSGPVVLVNGLHDQVDVNGQPYFCPNTLQLVMGVYGDVMRVKILPRKENKKTVQALVQFRRNEEASNAQVKLDGAQSM